eukprot:Skav211847  [mRNA]  locus=scaffold305:900230:900640:+ [translate_table: standard]
MDKSPLACSLLEANLYPVVLRGDVTVALDQARFQQACPDHRAGLLAGFPCQPFSRLGLQLAFQDRRSLVFFAVLDLAFLIQASFVLLECVTGAGSNAVVLSTLDSFCAARGFQRAMIVLHQHHVMPNNRTRWWCLL